MGANIKWKIPSLWEVMENAQPMGTAKPKENGASPSQCGGRTTLLRLSDHTYIERYLYIYIIYIYR
jgi:hypothetical protein